MENNRENAKRCSKSLSLFLALQCRTSATFKEIQMQPLLLMLEKEPCFMLIWMRCSTLIS